MRSKAKVLCYALGWVMFVLVTAFVTLLCVRDSLQKHNRALYEVVDPKGIDVLESINVGGVEQWLHIRGRNRNNPVLLFLHGGPGIPHIGWYDRIQRPWEDYFTVVQWDQRQVGKSYLPLSQFGKTLSNEQIVSDALEVIAYLRTKLGKEKLFIMGWSYGSYLGMKVAKKKPEWLHAYVGLGQSVSVMDSVREEHALLLSFVRTEGNKELVARLESMLPHPDPGRKMASYTEHSSFIMKELNRIGKLGDPEVFANSMRLNQLISPHYSLSELYSINFGDPTGVVLPESDYAEEFMNIDLPAEVGSRFKVPIIFFTGANDWHVPYTLTDKWFQQIQAPYKHQVWFYGSTHYPPTEEPGKLLESLVSEVLPLGATYNHTIH